GASLFLPDPTSSLTAAVEEKLIIDGPVGPFKAVWFVQFTADIRNDPQRTREAHEYWTRTHGGAFGVRVPGIDRYVQNHVVAPVTEGVELGYDGFSECWFQDRAAFDLTMGSTEWDEMNNDARTIFDRDWIVGGWSSLIDEIVVKA
ncbi:MAG TPA: EthD family reductase, partial [Ilumatobacteraceae bacterium]|nr:EthD family reductase [Ilumatobacteraceae bacterium]